MARPNRGRTIFGEEHLARRVAALRTERKMTLDGLAKRMTDAGCSITGSAIYKIESGNPRRAIKVDELIALSRVFAIPMDELCVPPELAEERELATLVTEWQAADRRVDAAEEELSEAYAKVKAWLQARPSTPSFVVDLINEVVVKPQMELNEWNIEDDPRVHAMLVARQMFTLTDDYMHYDEYLRLATELSSEETAAPVRNALSQHEGFPRPKHD